MYPTLPAVKAPRRFRRPVHATVNPEDAPRPMLASYTVSVGSQVGQKSSARGLTSLSNTPRAPPFNFRHSYGRASHSSRPSDDLLNPCTLSHCVLFMTGLPIAEATVILLLPKGEQRPVRRIRFTHLHSCHPSQIHLCDNPYNLATSSTK